MKNTASIIVSPGGSPVVNLIKKNVRPCEETSVGSLGESVSLELDDAFDKYLDDATILEDYNEINNCSGIDLNERHDSSNSRCSTVVSQSSLSDFNESVKNTKSERLPVMEPSRNSQYRQSTPGLDKGNRRLEAAAETGRAYLSSTYSSEILLPPRPATYAVPEIPIGVLHHGNQYYDVDSCDDENCECQYDSHSSLPPTLDSYDELAAGSLFNTTSQSQGCLRKVRVCREPHVVLFSEDDCPRDVCRQLTLKRRLRWRLRSLRRALVHSLGLE